MNELDLIKEVEKRPILYDKSVSGFNKTKLRDEAWREVNEALNVSGCTESECKKRWRSLRDSFIKLQRTHGGRTRWPYHHAMRFLMPHVEPKAESDVSTPRSNSKKKDSEDSDMEEEARQRAIQCLPDLSFMTQDKYEAEDSPEPSPKKARLNSAASDDENSNQCLCNRSDPDELFLLSCAPTLKRLNSKQNAVARLKIQQALYEAEFGSQPQQDMPFVAPTDGYE